MTKSSLPWSIQQMKNMYMKHTLAFDHPIQRKSNQWNEVNKTLLIHSILANYYIPPVFLIKESTGEVDKKGKPVYAYSVLDGKQRLSVIFDFLDDGFALHKDMPTVHREDEDLELGGMKFSEFDDDIRQDILRYVLTVQNIEDATDDEIEEQFYRLNNGVPLSANDKSRSKMGSEMVKFINEILAHHFFQICSFSSGQVRRSEDICALLQAMMIMDKSYRWKSIAATETLEYASNLKHNFSSELHDAIVASVNYLDKVFAETKDKNKWCKKINIPMLIVLANKSVENEITPEEFYAWFTDFFDKYTPACDYAQYCSTGSIKKDKTEGRLRIMTESWTEYFFEEVEEDEEAESDETEEDEVVNENEEEDENPEEENHSEIAATTEDMSQNFEEE